MSQSNYLRDEVSLWVFHMACTYFPHGDYMKVEVSGEHSKVWKFMSFCNTLLKEGIKWNIADGQKVSIWHDAWVPNIHGILARFNPMIVICNGLKRLLIILLLQGILHYSHKSHPMML